MELTSLINPETITKLKAWWYIIMFLLMVIEWPIITFMWAFLASIWVFNIYFVTILWWLADITGDIIFYISWRFWIDLFNKIFWKKENKNISNSNNIKFFQKLDEMIKKSLFKSLVIAKFTPYLQPILLTYLWKTKVDLKKYIFYSMILSVLIPWLASFSWFHIWQIQKYIDWKSFYEIITISIFIIILILFIVYLYLKFQKPTKDLKKYISNKN